jgi:CDP-paratose 2-epimerase
VKLLVTGICGFVGSTLARSLLESMEGLEIVGIDNLIRPGSELNRRSLAKLGVRFVHADLRSASDVDSLPQVDWVIDAAANASVLAGVDGKTSSRQILEHNLGGTINLLEYCKRHSAGFLLLSTSRVYAIEPLAALPMEIVDKAYRLKAGEPVPAGISERGLAEEFSTAAPISIYGATKLCSEQLALEYGLSFGFPVWVNRCGVLAGAGQFGRADQGIFTYWIHAYKNRRPLKYIGFTGDGYQVRDCLHPRDLAGLAAQQLREPDRAVRRVQNVSGGVRQSMSLAQLSGWCAARFGPHEVVSVAENRPFDIPWMVLDASLAQSQWDWRPSMNLPEILEEISLHAEENPGWLEMSAGN